MLLISKYSQPQLISLNIIPVGHKTSWSRHWQLQLDSSQTLSDCLRHMVLSDKLIHSHLNHEDCLWYIESFDHLHSSGWYFWRLWQWCSWTWHWQPQLRWRVRLVSTILKFNIKQQSSVSIIFYLSIMLMVSRTRTLTVTCSDSRGWQERRWWEQQPPHLDTGYRIIITGNSIITTDCWNQGSYI